MVLFQFDDAGKAISSKKNQKSQNQILQFREFISYDKNVVSIAENLKPSPRGEIGNY